MTAAPGARLRRPGEGGPDQDDELVPSWSGDAVVVAGAAAYRARTRSFLRSLTVRTGPPAGGGGLRADGPPRVRSPMH